jgi:uncharacterized protein (TIGR02600 family)
MVMLLTVLTVAFMMRAGSEKQSSGYYRAEATTRELSDTTLNLVEGEINEATTQGINYAWASQPGAIRVYDNTGAPYKTFKLYSAPSMVSATTALTGSSNSVASFITPDIPTASWISAPGMWVDLNAPTNSDPNPNATTGLGSPLFTHFPIVDPRDPATSPPTNTVTTKMDGFSITGAPTDTTSKIDTNGGPNLAPMPVQWLYVLQDGSLTAPTSGPDGSGNYKFTGAGVSPSAINPIVGRIAFWADDETCKVNINTAGADGKITNGDPTGVAAGPLDTVPGTAGTYWATPYFCTVDDANLANFQPFQGEFQRYPGHPGTVAFNNILNALGTTVASTSFYNYYTTTGGVTSLTSQGITPRYTYNAPVNASTVGNITTTTAILPLSYYRLFPTVAEMLFKTDRTATAFNGVSNKSRQQEETARFFLTAHSRAPELNLFGLPRVSIWPESYNATNMSTTTSLNLGTDQVLDSGINIAPPTTSSATAVDKLIGFDSCIGTYPYYFSRVAAGGPNYWYNPGNILTTGCQRATLDVNIPRNVQLLNYLDTLTSTPIPGYGSPGVAGLAFGGSANSKYGQWGMRQILTEIFDYIRITNVIDSTFTTFSGAERVNYSAPFPYAPPWEQPYGYAFGPGQVVPSYYSKWGTTGVGTLPVPTEVTLHFVALGDNTHPIPAAEWKGGVVPPGPDISSTDPVTHITTYFGSDPGIFGLPVAYDDTNIKTDTSTNSDGTPSPTNGQGDVGVGRIAIQAFVYVQWVFPAQWHLTQNPALNFSISGLNGLDITTAGKSTSFSMQQTHINPDPVTCLQFTANDCMRMDWAASQGEFGIPFTTGYYPAYGMVGSQTSNRILGPVPTGKINGNGGNIGNPTSYVFPFYSSVFTVPTGSNLGLNGTTITISLYNGNYLGPAPGTGDPNLFSSYKVSIPVSTFPAPVVDPNGYRIIGTQAWRQGYVYDGGTYNPVTAPNSYNPSPLYDERWWLMQDGGYLGSTSTLIDSNFVSTNPGPTYDVAKSVLLSGTWQDARMLLAGSSVNPVPTDAFSGHPLWNTLSNTIAHTLIFTGTFWFPGATQTPLVWGVSTAMAAAGNPNPGAPYQNPSGYHDVPYASPWTTSIITGGSPGASLAGHTGAYTNTGAPGDWDNGISFWGDGPWINKADEGSFAVQNNGQITVPYFGSGNLESETNWQSLFSPNKEIPSAGMFGSLPTGVPNILDTSYSPQPYQTLLFRPGSGNAAVGGTHHPGEANYRRDGSQLAGTPPDHVLMDLFWMPVAEPYPISEPYSTAGKINLNYQILPFTYIKRATALRAALAAEKVAKSPASDVNSYKTGAVGQNNPTPFSNTTSRRLALNLDETTSQFDTKFAGWDVFHSASQICDIFLVPQGYTASTFPAKWYDLTGDFALVGDNVRERPYADIYQKVTTKSNSYTVYYRVQSLKKPTSVAVDQWNENLGAVTGEYRGSTTIERFIDPNEKNSAGTVLIPDVATTLPNPITPSTPNLEGYYKWRVVENHQFAP